MKKQNQPKNEFAFAGERIHKAPSWQQLPASALRNQTEIHFELKFITV